MNEERYLSAEEAAHELEVTKNTLYAYVSRGLIRSEAAGGSRRRKKYHAEDVRRLQQKQARRHDPSEAARSALDFGLPVMESALTLIEGGRFFYRGRDACRLACSHALRDVAALLWLEDLEASLPEAEAPPLSTDLRAAVREQEPVERFQSVLPSAAAHDERAAHFSRPAVALTGTRLLHLVGQVFAEDGTAASATLDLAGAFQGREAAQGDAAHRLLRAALVLCADHELNVTAMAARCAAAAGATPYGVVQAGLSALCGRRHAGRMARIEALLREAGTPERLRPTLAGRLQRGDAVPGFGHRLYPDGDPRAETLFELLQAARPDAEGTAFAAAAMEAGPDLLDRAPAVDFVLVTLRRALGLSPGESLALFAAGRIVGWIGHAIEQYEAERPIRPRATYTGPRPGD